MIAPGMEHGPPRLRWGRATFVVRVFRAAALPHQQREAAAALKTGWPMWGKREIATPSWAEPSGESVSSVESVDHLLILKLGELRWVGNQFSFIHVFSRLFAVPIFFLAVDPCQR